MLTKNHSYLVGIDTGTQTGFAEWSRFYKSLMAVDCLKIHKATDRICLLQSLHANRLFVRVEDARLRTWFGKSGPEVWKGAGSICRDAKIWEDFLADTGISFEMVSPKNNKTKVTHEYFTKLTGWGKPTNEHSRDAAMLVYGY